MIKVGIIGATGYTGLELIRILSRHPGVELSALYSGSSEGEDLAAVYPQFAGSVDLAVEKYSAANIEPDIDLYFTALPHGVSQHTVVELRELGFKVVDLSGDFRYENKDVYENWYGIEHKYSDYLGKAVYGLVEFYREQIKETSLVANPGCYPTASLLGLLPLVREKAIDPGSIVIDAKSGVSGAGKKLKRITHFTEVDENIRAYAVGSHRHTSEIEARLSTGVAISFTPHLVPLKRGILATIYADLESGIGGGDIEKIYENYYGPEKFIHRVASPQIGNVAGSNYCHLDFTVDERTERIIVISVIDNLVKGAAGQAVQNMNLMLGIPEETGLTSAGMFP